MQGRIIKYSRDREFGFILPDGENPELVFFRPSALCDMGPIELAAGMRVEFKLTRNDKGAITYHCRILADGPAAVQPAQEC